MALSDQVTAAIIVCFVLALCLSHSSENEVRNLRKQCSDMRDGVASAKALKQEVASLTKVN